MERVTRSALGIIGTIVTVVTFVSILTSPSLRAWVSRHSIWAFYGLVFFFLISAVSLNYALDLKRRNQKLTTLTSQKVTDHDKGLFKNIVSKLPPDGPIMEWLKENFISKYAPSKLFDSIEELNRNLRLQPLGFDDPDVNAAYEKLVLAMEGFESTVLNYMWLDESYKRLVVPPEWNHERSSKAYDEIVEARNCLLREYDAFLAVSHTNGVDK